MKRKLLVLLVACLVSSSSLSLPAVNSKALALGYFGYRAYKELKANWKNIQGEGKPPAVENKHPQAFTSNPSFKGSSTKKSDRLYSEALYWDKEAANALENARFYSKMGRYDTANIYLRDAKEYARKADTFRSDATFEKSHGN